MIRFGVFELDAQSGELRKRGVRIKLQEQPFQILQILLERPGEIVTREELQKRIWPANTFVDFDKGLYNAVKKLRESLGDDAVTPLYIETVPKRGYRFIAPVDAGPSESLRVPNESGQPGPVHLAPVIEISVAMPATMPTTDQPPSRRYIAALVGGGAALLIVLMVAGVRYWHIRAARGLTPKDTIVLGDFTNTTGEKVFDDALKLGLEVDLEQSTFLNLLSDEKIKEQLRYMGRPEDQSITPEIAREVCRRNGSKAALLSSIAPLGNHYVITLAAENCQNSDLLDEEQGETDRREKILTELHQLAKRMRGKLGESLASIQQNDTPLEQATTSSLEALQAYSLASRTYRLEGATPAVPLFKHAIELDPGFAQAYADLSVAYFGLHEYALARESAEKAYTLRGRVSQFEKFSIDFTLFQAIGDLEKEAQVLEAWKRTYPGSLAPYVNLGFVDSYLGRLDDALNDDLQGLALGRATGAVYSNLADDYMSLDRPGEAAAILEQARKRNLDEPMEPEKYQLAFLQGDERKMSSLVNEASGKVGIEDALLSCESDTEAFHGRLQRARTDSRLAVDSALRNGSKETAAGWQANLALREAELGEAAEAQREATIARSMADTKELQVATALALARSGETALAERTADILQRKFPEDTLLRNYWLPVIRAAVALHQNQPQRAIDGLRSATPYELGGGTPPFSAGATMYPTYLLGEAYLNIHEWALAAAQFSKIRDHRGLVWNSPIAALAWLELGRSYSGAGDHARAVIAYRQFLSLWNGADLDNSTLRAARSEYAALH